jgi:hypothetical protein
MSNHPDREAFTEPGADREPTPEEEAAAERSADELDVDGVAEHAEDMYERGANVKGEGQIES